MLERRLQVDWERRLELVQAIHDRRERTVKRALAVLEGYPDADAQTRQSLMKMGGKALRDERVATRWLELLAAENDPDFRRQLIERLATLDFREIPNGAPVVARLLECLGQPDAREWALYCLRRIAPHDPALIAPLIAAYRTQRHDDFAQRLLSSLVLIGNPPRELLDFFLTVLDEVNIDFKIVIVHKLLEQDGLSGDVLQRLLAPGEPTVVKVLALDHLIDRSLRADDLAAVLLSADPDPAVRYAAAWALTETGAPTPQILGVLLKVASSDPDSHIRQFVLEAFDHTLSKSPETLAALVAALPAETATERAAMILRLLTPYLRQSPELIRALQTLVETNLNADLAAEIYATLGSLAPWLPELKEWLLTAFEREKHDRIKAAILRPLARLNDGGTQAVQLCREAVRLPDPELQQWGARGLLLLPQTPENADAILESASVLLSKELPLELRIQLAKKLAIVPKKSAALLARFKEVAEQAPEAQLQRVCEEACNAALTDAVGQEGADGPDWAGWTQRAEVEHRGDGIFPAIYEHYDANPETARRVLKALLNPACSDNLYSCYGYSVSASSILDLLDRKNAIDDECSRFIVARVLTQDGSPDGFIQFLSANPAWPQLTESVFTIIERRGDADRALLREVLIAAYGGDDAAAEALAKKMAAASSGALAPYVHLLTHNLAWPPAGEVLLPLVQRTDLSATLAAEIQSALKKLGVTQPVAETKPPPPKPEPGFADD